MIERPHVKQAAKLVYPEPFGRHVVQYPVSCGKPLSYYLILYIGLSVLCTLYWMGQLMGGCPLVQWTATVSYTVPYSGPRISLAPYSMSQRIVGSPHV